MAKIMLLDDSPVMHRVVKLTFADDPRMEIAVARNPEEAEQSLANGHTDLIIAYARFVGDSPVSYFEALSFASPRILILAEDDENMEPFIQSGFNSILRKPFHSDELRTVVEELLSSNSGMASKPKPQPPKPPPIPPARSGAPTPPAPPPASAAPARNSAPTPPAPPRASAAPARSSAPSTGSDFSTNGAFSSSLHEQDETTRELEDTSVNHNASNTGANSAAQASFKAEPRITLDLSGLRQLALENTLATSRPHLQFTEEEDSLNQKPQSLKRTEKTLSGSKAEKAVFSKNEMASGIEPSEWDDSPMALENVMVSTRLENHGAAASQAYQLSHEDVETIVEGKVATAVDRAVRQALNETLPELRQAVVNEVSQRAVEQLSAELLELRQALRNSMSAELKELSSQWLRRETPSLAKDVIREEIRRVIEAI
jgi:CheY-like chemotaxis protein